MEADGAARGNPGPASYGALVRDADTGELLAERGEALGHTTNNVAEYRGLIGGLEAAFEIDPQAQVEVRMDSKLVIEQMAGRWSIKHPNLKPLASRAKALITVPGQVRWTWIPRADNSHADRLANEALDGPPSRAHTEVVSAQPVGGDLVLEGAPGPAPKIIGWATDMGAVTTLRLLRHGETAHTIEKRFSGVAHDPELSERGFGQARATAAHLAATGGIDEIVSSPLRRAHQTARAVGDALGLDVRVEDGFRECDFGVWDGLTFADVQAGWPNELTTWLAGFAVAPPGGESLLSVSLRVAAAQEALIERSAGRNVLVVAHVIPIKLLVRLALGAHPEVVHRLQLAPASLSTVAWYADGNAALHGFNDTGHLGEWARLDGS